MVENKVVCLSSSDSETDDTLRNEFSRGKKRRFHCSFHCTACGTEMLGISEIHEHPWLHGVGICSDCFDILLNNLFTKDPVDGTDEQCRWCGQGGTLIICENCEKVFCEDCIVRNYGRKRGLAPILSKVNWSCFCCNPKPLWVHVERLKEFRNSVSSERNFSPRPKEARTSRSRTRYANQNASDVNRGNRTKTSNKEQKQVKGSQTSVATPCTKQRHPPESGKQPKGIEKPQQQAPSLPPARTFIRPHQMTEKRREAAERRKRIAAERLKSSVVTNVKENGTQQQYNSILQAKPEIQDGGGQLSKHEREVDDESKVQQYNSILQAKLEIQDGGGQLSRQEREVDDESKVQQYNSILQAKLEIQDGGGQFSRHEREVDDESKVKRNCSVM